MDGFWFQLGSPYSLAQSQQPLGFPILAATFRKGHDRRSPFILGPNWFPLRSPSYFFSWHASSCFPKRRQPRFGPDCAHRPGSPRHWPQGSREGARREPVRVYGTHREPTFDRREMWGFRPIFEGAPPQDWDEFMKLRSTRSFYLTLDHF